MSNALTFLGLPLQFLDYCEIYPPTIRDVLDNKNFNKYLSILTVSQEDIEDQLFNSDEMIKISEGDIPTPYQYVCQVCLLKQEYLDLVCEGFEFFTHKKLTFIPETQMFLLGDLEQILLEIKDIKDLPILKEEDFFEFQNLIRMSIGTDPCQPYNYNLHPKARRMKAKQRLRDRVKNKQNEKKNSLENNLASICCMGIGLNPLNIGEMSYAAMSTIIKKYQMKEKYEIDMKILTSGFGSNKKIKPKYWMQENED